MTRQGILFAPGSANREEPIQARVLARADDPATSKQAARSAANRLGKQQARTLNTVAAMPGSTAWELAGGNVTLRYLYNRRLPELVMKGVVRRGEPRACRITGTEQTTWWPT